MRKEIFEQPEAISKTIHDFSKLEKKLAEIDISKIKIFRLSIYQNFLMNKNSKLILLNNQLLNSTLMLIEQTIIKSNQVGYGGVFSIVLNPVNSIYNLNLKETLTTLNMGKNLTAKEKAKLNREARLKQEKQDKPEKQSTNGQSVNLNSSSNNQISTGNTTSRKAKK